MPDVVGLAEPLVSAQDAAVSVDTTPIDTAAAPAQIAPAASDASVATSTSVDVAVAAHEVAPLDAVLAVPVADAPNAPLAPSPPVPPTGVYATAEEAVLVYIEGTRKQDPERLWSVMTESARKILDQVVVKARSAPETELAKIGLSPALLVDMTPRAFFDHMVRHAPRMDAAELAEPLHDLVTTPEGSERAKVVFKLGKTSCEADTMKDSQGWKVEVSRCTGP